MCDFKKYLFNCECNLLDIFFNNIFECEGDLFNYFCSFKIVYKKFFKLFGVFGNFV